MNRIRFIARCVFSLALIVFIARKLNWAQLGSVLARIDWRWAAAGSILTGLLIGALAARWRIFLREQKIELTFGTVLSLTWAGQFFNSVLPGSTGGDVFKIYQLCRLAPDRKAAAAATVVVDRFSA
ncbi:MAG TPA: lysylphosphatidylglycerol synthase transmembrane domain-containing protein, partial [Chthoniobacterales bacterium]